MKKKRTISRTKTPVLDKGLGDALKKEGMEAVTLGVDPAWRRLAQSAILKVARRQEYLTADDVWKTGLSRPREPRALGPEMNAAEVAGIIVTTDQFRLTAQASRHRAPVRVWQSLAWKSDPTRCVKCRKKTSILYGGLCIGCDAKEDRRQATQKRAAAKKTKAAAKRTSKKRASKRPAKKRAVKSRSR